MLNNIRFALAAAVVGVSMPAAAATVDQAAYVVPSGLPMYTSWVTRMPSGYERWQAQSVTAGMAGLLKTVDLQIGGIVGAGDLVLSIGAGEVTDSGFSVLGSVSLLYGDVPLADDLGTAEPGYARFDVSGLGLMVTPGMTFTLLVSAGPSAVATRYGWAFAETPDGSEVLNPVLYAGGVNRISDDHGASWTETFYDRGFRTWVAGVPEPATWAMLVAGFGLVGAAARRRRAAVSA